MKTILKRIFNFILAPLFRKYQKLIEEIEENRVLTAKLLINQIRKGEWYSEKIYDYEFKVFSQQGEDGIIQYLISQVEIKNPVFVEFGVENYRESNTRFLLVNNNWRGLIFDSDKDNIKYIKHIDLYWKYDLTAVQAFITRDNINDLIKSNKVSGDIGLLSIDIDGNDYWVWESISVISPRIVVCEYNSLFGAKEAVTIPYYNEFNRTQMHYSNLYFGASLKALCMLGRSKGYILVGSNSTGSNAFFVRKDIAGNLRGIDCETGYVESKFRESRSRSGKLTFESGKKRLSKISDMQLWDLEGRRNKKISELSI